jgi:hypothetical protein
LLLPFFPRPGTAYNQGQPKNESQKTSHLNSPPTIQKIRFTHVAVQAKVISSQTGRC